MNKKTKILFYKSADKFLKKNIKKIIEELESTTPRINDTKFNQMKSQFYSTLEAAFSSGFWAGASYYDKFNSERRLK